MSDCRIMPDARRRSSLGMAMPADIARSDDAGIRHHHSRRCSSIAGDGEAGSGVLIASAAIIAYSDPSQRAHILR
jgi:hypothetical protein